MRSRSPHRFLLALAVLGLAGCGGPGGAPDQVQLALERGNAALGAGRFQEAARHFEEARANSGSQGFDSTLRLRSLEGLVRCRRAEGRHLEAQKLAWKLRGLGSRLPELPVWLAELALETGRDQERSYQELVRAARSAEEKALADRLRLRLESPDAVPGPAGPPAGEQAALLAADLAPTHVEALSRLEDWRAGWKGPAPGPSFTAELLALQVDGGAAPGRIGPRLDRHPWRSRMVRLALRSEWQTRRPGEIAGERWRELRRDRARAADPRVRLVAATVEGMLPPGPRRDLGDLPEGQLVDRDPVSPRRGIDSHPRVTLIRLPGLSAHYLWTSLEAGHFPYLRALRSRGTWAELPEGVHSEWEGPALTGMAESVLAVIGTAPSAMRRGEVLAWSPPRDRLPASLDPARAAEARDRLFPDGIPEPVAGTLARQVVDYDRQLGTSAHVGAQGREDLRPTLAILDLPPIGDIARLLLPLQPDCRPPADSLAGRHAALIGGFENSLDRLVGRLDKLIGRMAPTLDRDDHVLVVSGSGQPGEGGVLLAYGPAFEPGERTRVELTDRAVLELASWIARGRRGDPPAGAAGLATSLPISPFTGG